ncbi:MAG: tRNA (guanosine(37)-N1)-methyltransferase TrmD [Chloroflexi bacterium]|nr:tRNA (guanosine(37)-N1)-methyltransferase TrmD [Chloroflexota bacterium]
MRIDIMTLFPEMFSGVFCQSIIGRAVGRGLVDIRVHDFREYAHDKHHTVDDYPYGGGAGMVLKPEPLFESVEAVLENVEGQRVGPVNHRIVLLTPQGQPFTQGIARGLSTCDEVVLICGHYEGVDERVRQHLITNEISIGDYVLTGGELPAMVVTDAICRLIPGVLGASEAAADDSFSNGLLQFPQYTRPPMYRGWSVPEVLLSGNHAEIARWRKEESLKRTRERRPELLDKAQPCLDSEAVAGPIS